MWTNPLVIQQTPGSQFIKRQCENLLVQTHNTQHPSLGSSGRGPELLLQHLNYLSHCSDLTGANLSNHRNWFFHVCSHKVFSQCDTGERRHGKSDNFCGFQKIAFTAEGLRHPTVKAVIWKRVVNEHICRSGPCGYSKETYYAIPFFFFSITSLFSKVLKYHREEVPQLWCENVFPTVFTVLVLASGLMHHLKSASFALTKDITSAHQG